MKAIISLFLWVPLFAFGSSNSSETFYFILSQFFNFSLFLILLLYIIYKKTPQALKNQEQQFLSNRHVYTLEAEKKKQACQKLTKDIEHLDQRIKFIGKEVTKAIEDQMDTWRIQMKERQLLRKDNFEKKLNKDKFKAIKKLRDKTMRAVLQSAKNHIIQNNLGLGLEQHTIKKLEKL